MARLGTFPCRLGLGNSALDGAIASGTVTIDNTTTPGSYKCDSAVGNLQASFRIDTPGSGVAVAFIRDYVMWSANPTGTVTILAARDTGGNNVFGARLLSTGAIELWRLTGVGSPVKIGTGSFAGSALTRYRLELKVTIGVGATDAAELYVATGEGQAALVDGATGLDCGFDNNIRLAEAGWLAAPGASRTINVDNIAFNDATGADQNAYPGPGRAYVFSPISDNARVGFTGGAGGTTSLFDAVDNKPPAGVAVGSATNTSQIKASTNADNYEANLTLGVVAGMADSDAVMLVLPVVDIGTDSATAATFTVQPTGNPSLASGGPSTGTAIAGSWPTNWYGKTGTIVYNVPTWNLGASTKLKLTRGAAATTHMADTIAMFAEVAPGSRQVYPMANVTQAAAGADAPTAQVGAGGGASSLLNDDANRFLLFFHT